MNRDPSWHKYQGPSGCRACGLVTSVVSVSVPEHWVVSPVEVWS